MRMNLPYKYPVNLRTEVLYSLLPLWNQITGQKWEKQTVLHKPMLREMEKKLKENHSYF